MTISCSSSLSPSTSAWTRTLVRSSVGVSRRSAISLRQRSKISGTSLLHDRARCPRGPGRARRRRASLFISRAQIDVVLGRDAHEAADDPRDHRLGDVVDQVARLAAVEPVEDADRDLADRVLVLGDPLRREAALEERLEPVVLWRVHADEHRLDQLQRHDRVGERRDPAALGRVGLPVAADGVDVVGQGHRPEAVLLGVLADLLEPVHRALRAHALEQLVGRSLRPMLAVADQDFVQRRLSGRLATLGRALAHLGPLSIAGWSPAA